MTNTPEQRERPAQMDAVFTDVSQYGDVRNLEMIKRRQDHLGGSILFYHDPINIVRGEGVWLYDDLGNKYLDCYNNVASVGHCNPNVVEALIAQARQLNTHTRYLHKNVIDYAEKLSGLMPAPLEVCLFTCTGTEANELAMRIARSVSGKHGAIVMESSYHGNSTLITQMSTALYPANLRPDFIKTVEPPNTYRGPFREGEHNDLGRRYADLVDEAIDDLEKNGHGTAAFMCDMIFDSQGSLCAPEEYFRRVYDKIHSAGGLCIADEVQPGLCRTGTWWGFENYGVVPDIVVLGKPMGDGHPVAAVVTSKEIIEKFTESQVYFNTFAGNPVSAAVGMAVLDECLDQKLVQNCAEVGAYFRKRLEVLAEKYPIIGHIHGMGLFLGIELVHDRKSKEPANDITRLVPDAMKNAGVLMGATGRFGNVLKIRPPLIFSKENVDQTIEALDKVLPEAVKTAGKEAPVDIQSGTATMQIDQGIVTEQLLLKALEKGCRCIQAAGNIVITPLARDIAREHKIKIERM